MTLSKRPNKKDRELKCALEYVSDRPSENVDNIAIVECNDCEEEFIRESHDFGDFEAGKQLLKNQDYEVVARVH